MQKQCERSSRLNFLARERISKCHRLTSPCPASHRAFPLKSAFRALCAPGPRAGTPALRPIRAFGSGSPSIPLARPTHRGTGRCPVQKQCERSSRLNFPARERISKCHELTSPCPARAQQVRAFPLKSTFRAPLRRARGRARPLFAPTVHSAPGISFFLSPICSPAASTDGRCKNSASEPRTFPLFAPTARSQQSQGLPEVLRRRTPGRGRSDRPRGPKRCRTSHVFPRGTPRPSD